MLAVAGFLLGGGGLGLAPLAVAGCCAGNRDRTSGRQWRRLAALIALDCAAPRGVQPRGGPYLRTAIGITGYRPS
jgi:hypothetical protein